MAARYAKGRRAWGECARSGKRLKRKDMVEDGYVPGLLVAPDWHDGPHPLDKPIKFDDPIAIRRPAPRRDKSQDSYGPDERFDDEQLMAKPHLVAAINIGPFTIQIEANAGSGTLSHIIDDLGKFFIDDSGNRLVTDGAAAPPTATNAGSHLIDDNGRSMVDDNANHIVG